MTNSSRKGLLKGKGKERGVFDACSLAHPTLRTREADGAAYMLKNPDSIGYQA